MTGEDKKSKMKWWFEHVVVPFIIVVLAAIFLPMVTYWLDIEGKRTEHLRLLIVFIGEDIERAEGHCGPMAPLDAAKKHRSYAEDALIIEKDFGAAEDEIKEARKALKEAREIGCPEAAPPPDPGEWWDHIF